jgi:hypothetical protein
MIKMTLLTLFLTISLRCIAPVYPVLYIPVAEKIYKSDPMLYAFMYVESNFDKDTVNSCNAGGILQIRPEMIEEANRILKLRKVALKYVLDDRLDSAKSVQIWYIVQGYWNRSYNLKRAAKIWNPLANKYYYLRINKVMLSL